MEFGQIDGCSMDGQTGGQRENSISPSPYKHSLRGCIYIHSAKAFDTYKDEFAINLIGNTSLLHVLADSYYYVGTPIAE